ncbi:exo-alpha-sialidase, partial [Candidatus Poribacteria bacterium]|nr:exo-alpha-sialidase [Candidatus Poribacteria bacterium]
MSDPRNIENGLEIPTESYADQPYIVKTDDGAWLCAVTTGGGHEGQPGQHVITMRSTDLGKTWDDRADVEPADGPEASYAVLLKTSYGRIYCFYNHNTDNQREVIADDPPYTGGKCARVDSLGYYVFKHSDDHGRTWSAERSRMPVREFDIDRENAYGGSVRFFWN